MPLLLYVVVTLLILAAVARWVMPLSRRDGAVLSLLPLVEAGEALIRGQVLAPIDLPWFYPPLAAHRAAADFARHSPAILHDQWTQLIPWQQATRAALAAGEWPLWNPYAALGEPLLGSYQPAVLHPVHLVSLLLPLPQALTLTRALTLLLAALGMYLLARDLELGATAALTGAAIWSSSQYLLFWLGWPVALAAVAVPPVLLAVRRVTRRPRPSSAVGLALAFTLLLLAGNPEVAVVGALLALALILTELVGARERSRALAAGGAAALLAVALCAVQLFPFVEAMTQTTEYAQRNQWQLPRAGSAAAQKGRQVWTEALLPFVHGVQAPAGTPATEARPIPDAVWGGALALVAALAALAGSRRPRRGYFAIVTLAGLAFAAGFRPLLWVSRQVPGLALVRYPYGALAGTLGLAVLAAFGVDCLARGEGRRWWRISGVMAGLAALAVYWSSRGQLQASGLDSGEAAFRLGLVLAFLMIATVLLPAPRARRWLPPLALLLVLGERQLESGTINLAFDARYFFPRVAPLDRIPEPAPDAPERVFGVGPYLYPDQATMWGLEDPRGYNPLTLARWNDLYPLWGGRRLTHLVVSDELAPLLSLFNVRWALVPAGFEHVEGWKRRSGRNGTWLLENLRVLPRAFVPRRLRWTDDPRASLTGVARMDDAGRIAWLEPVNGTALEGGGSPVENPRGTVEILASGQHARFRTRFEQPGWVVVSVAAWKGWRASVEQRPLPLAVANHALVAFRAPSGTHEVALDYTPRAFVWGLRLSGVTWIALLSIAIGAVAQRRIRFGRRNEAAAGAWERRAPVG